MNGWAIMQGVRLTELDPSDLLDVFHYMFEIDTVNLDNENFEPRDALRSALYRRFYEQEYRYASDWSGRRGSTSATGVLDLPEDEKVNPLVPFDPKRPQQREVKPYIPPTEPNLDADDPFGFALGAPMN